MIIYYDPEFNDFTHNGDLIFDLEKFIATAFGLGETIEFKTC